MKLVRFGSPGTERPGIIDIDGRVRDISVLVKDLAGDAFQASGLSRIREAVASDVDALPVAESDSLRLGPPVGRPQKIICVGLNYADHASESGMDLPTEPALFSKPTNTLVGPSDDVLLPPDSQKTDWEIELAIVIGGTARYVADAEHAAALIAGYTISNDVSEREYQLERGGQWIKGKSCETFNPLGPWVVTADDIDPSDLSLELKVNGETMQRGTTRDMVFDPAHIVWYVSQFMVLEPGDIINTGTPAGVGMGRSPQRFLRRGDVMELTIEGLGSQMQKVV